MNFAALGTSDPMITSVSALLLDAHMKMRGLDAYVVLFRNASGAKAIAAPIAEPGELIRGSFGQSLNRAQCYPAGSRYWASPTSAHGLSCSHDIWRCWMRRECGGSACRFPSGDLPADPCFTTAAGLADVARMRSPMRRRHCLKVD